MRSRRGILFIIILSQLVLVSTINVAYYTGYTKPIIDLSRNICSLKFYLDHVEWFYTDYVKISDEKYVFAGPIGTPLILSIAMCLARGDLSPLLLGGLVMSVATTLAIVAMYFLMRELYEKPDFIMTSILITLYASLPWIYSSHIFPQALSTLFTATLLYSQIAIILKNSVYEISIKHIFLNSISAGMLFLTDPSAIILITASSLYTLYSLARDSRDPMRKTLPLLVVIALLWLSIFSLFIFFQLYYNYATTGNPFLFPEILYSETRGLGTGLILDPVHVIYALYIQLIDPRKSLLFLYPLSFISLVYLFVEKRFLAKRTWFLLVIYTTSILATYSMWHDFHGGLSYGPRFLSPMTLLLSIPLNHMIKSRGRYARIMILLLTLYEVVENSIVLTTTPYPCALQDLSILGNQFFTCSLGKLGEDTRSSLLYTVLHKDLEIPSNVSTIISILLEALSAYTLVLVSYMRKI